MTRTEDVDSLLAREQGARAAAEDAAERARRLQSAAEALAEAVSRENVAHVLLEQAIAALGAAAGIFAAPQGDEVELIAAAGYSDETVEAWRRFPRSSAVPATDVLDSGEAVWIGSAAELIERYPSMEALQGVSPYHGALITVPLLIGGAPVAALGLRFAEERRFPREDRALVLAIARSGAQALQRAMLYESERLARERAERSHSRTARLQDATSALAGADTPRDVIDVLLGHLPEAVGADAAIVLVPAEDGLRVAGEWNFPPELATPDLRIPLDGNLPSAEAFRTGVPVWVESPEQLRESYQVFETMAGQLGSRAFVALPLAVAKRPIGAVGLHFVRERSFDLEERALLVAISGQCAQALQRTQLLERERQEELLLRRLAETNVIGTLVVLDDAIVEANDAFLSMVGYTRAELEAGALHWPAMTPPEVYEDADRRALKELFATGRCEAYEKEYLHKEGRRVPVLVGLALLEERPLRAIAYVLDLSERAAAEEERLRLLEGERRMRAEVEEAHEHLAHLYEERSRVAETLQRSLLPPTLPEIPGIDAAARYRPAGDANEVGGDFYDVFEVAPGSGTWTVALGDVVGKGAKAAAIMGLARYTIRTAALERRRPAGILSVLNESVLRQTEPEEYLTACFARLDVRQRGAKLVFSCGGHPAPVVLRADGSVEHTECEGSLLGVFSEPDLVEATVELEPGDAILMFTDGVTDERDGSGEQFGERRLDEVVAGSVGSSAEAIATRVLDEVLRFTPNDPKDDIALVVLRVDPGSIASAPIVERTLPATPESVAVARAAVDELAGRIPDPLMEDLRLLVSELVTNSIRHAGLGDDDRITLGIRRTLSGLRVEVANPGEGFRAVPVPEASTRVPGWGLVLVERLATRWGVDDAELDGRPMTTVWLEIDQPVGG